MIQMSMANWGLVNAQAHVDEKGGVSWTGDCEGDILDVPHGIMGHYDGLTRPIKGSRYLLEFKTCNDKPKTVALFMEERDGIPCTVKYVVGEGQSAFSPEILRMEGSPPKPLKNRGNEEWLEIAEKMGVVSSGRCIVKKAILDVTVVPGKFSKLESPSIEHVTQASFYANTLGADRCLVIYLAKDHQGEYEQESIFNIPIKAFEFEPDMAAVSKFESRSAEVWDWVNRGELPPREFSPGKMGSECRWCNFAHLCYPDDPEVKAKTARFSRELKVIGAGEFSSEPWQTHTEDEQGQRLIESGLKDGQKKEDSDE
jgi:hypothetical protein